MKRLLLLLFIFPILLTAQERYIPFDAAERPEDAEYDSIFWQGADKVRYEFTLQGKKPAKCRLSVIADGNVAFRQYVQNKWELIDTLSYIVFLTGDKEYLTPQFQITDFNKDGLEDFVFLPMTNMHGSMAYSIYLQDNEGIVRKLSNSGFDNDGDEDTWPAADYDAATRIISCVMPGGAFGSSWEATYRLDGYTAVPTAMHNESRAMQVQCDQYFKGIDNKWTLTRQQVHIALGIGYENDEPTDVISYRLDQDKDESLKLYRIDGGEDPAYQEAIAVPGFLNEVYDDKFYDHIPCFQITDLNRDGDQDLVFYTGASVHGSITNIIYLADRKSKKLIKLQNTAEGSDIWDTPVYDPKTKIITCDHMEGNAGLSFTSTYRLKGFIAEPLQKEVKDRTNLNSETGKGYSESTYKGKKGKWVLVDSVMDK